MVQFREAPKGNDSISVTYMTCTVQDIDLNNMVAHVVDSLGRALTISLTRSMGKQVAYPAIGEDWFITRQYGDWVFAVAINTGLVNIVGVLPTGGAANDVLSKISGTNYDTQWETPVSTNSGNAILRRDAAGRAQVTTPSVGNDIANKTYVDSGISALSTSITGTIAGLAVVPTGTILAYGGSTAPTGFVACDGVARSRTTFATLFGVIGTAFGVGDGSTTFNFPNFNAGSGDIQRFPLGGVTVGSKGGASSHSHTQGTLSAADHNHGLASGYARIAASASTPAFGVQNINPTASWTSTVTGGGVGSSSSTVFTRGAALGGTTDNSGALTVTGTTDVANLYNPWQGVLYIIKT